MALDRRNTDPRAGQPFRTPNAIQFNYEDLYSYGSEMMTASANYRPGNSNTQLRKKGAPKVPAQVELHPDKVQPKGDFDKSEKMDPCEDSFHISPINNDKYEDGKEESKKGSRKVSKQPTSNVTISGVSEFDYLGNSDTADKNKKEDDQEKEDLDPTRKSLEKDFQEAAEADID